MIKKICHKCNKEYLTYPCYEKTTKFCSRSCTAKASYKPSAKRLENLRKVVIGNKYRLGLAPVNKGVKGQIAWNKGLKTPQESIEKMRLTKTGIPSYRKGLPFPQGGGKNHWNWKGGIADENRVIRQSVQYKNWRLEVLQRDRFTCVKCGYRSCKRRDVRVDHIKPFCEFPDLRFIVSNGRTLCIPCDLKYGWNYFRAKNEK